jgi:fibronectin type 3 domain-containing protein
MTSFAANPASIAAGGTASLTGVFANGTGIITPGNLPVTSGTPVSVTPSNTTTYTLTVTNAAGVTAAQTATVTVSPVSAAAPTITSFAANPTSIATDGSASLTGVFANGTGVITPGNLPATSGTAVVVMPSDTTTYTLTVTNAQGKTVSQTAVVTVIPPVPVITSFTAIPPSIPAGGSANLTGVFSNGNGVITPGNLPVTSGTALSVMPSATTTYTLTVTPSAGAPVTQSLTVTVTSAGGPAAPTALVATAGNQQVSLSWTGVAAASSYSVMRSTSSGGPYTAIGTTTSTEFEDDAVANNTTYCYVVAAIDGSDQSGNSNQALATPMAQPGSPANLVATAGPGDGQIQLTWTAGTGAVSYQVGRSAVSGGPYTTVSTPTTTVFSDTGLTDGATYYYVVYSLNPVSTSTASNQAMAIPIAAVTGLDPIANDKQVALFWNSSAGATSYNISQFSQSGCSGAGAQASSPLPRYVESGLTDGSTYYFEVTAVNSTGASAPSACVSATPSASTASLPPAQDPAKNYVGLGTWFLNDWDGSYAFLDLFKQSRTWDTAAWGTTLTNIDSNGWPKQDASTVILTDTLNNGTQFNGTYDLSFTGQAKVSVMWCNGGVTNQSYNVNTNITTAKVTFTESGSPSCGLAFTNTQRTAASAVGTGFTNAHLYLSATDPGSENPAQGTTIFSNDFLTAMGKVGTVRMMDWTNTNGNYLQYWEDRVTPSSATQAGIPNSWTGPDGTVYNGTGGVALEYQIILCNTLLVDCYFNIPMVAGTNPSTGSDYVTNMALAIAYGTDGTNPYTSPQSNPVYPPLNPNLRFYLEYANEVWNTSAGVYPVVADICQYLPANSPLYTPDNNPSTAGYNQYYTIWRYPAFRMYSISQTFEGIFPGQMMARVRPLVEEQQGNGQDTLHQALTWLDYYTQSQGTTVAQVVYGGGGSAYYPNGAGFSDPSTYFNTSYPDAATTQNWATDSMWTTNYGIKHVAYEGGPGLSFSNSADVSLIDNSQMETFMDDFQTDWAQMGGDVLVYYTVEGPGDWEFTPDINPNDGPFTGATTPKFLALADIQAAPKAAVTLGAPLPGTLSLSNETKGPVNGATYQLISGGSSGYSQTIGGQSCESGINTGSYVAYPASNAGAAFSGSLTLSGSSTVATQVGIWINGTLQGTVTLAASPNKNLENSTSLSVNIPAGLSMIRLQVNSGTLSFCSLTVP